jgi:hypothetical protein
MGVRIGCEETMNEQLKKFLQPVSWIRTIVIVVICGLIAWKLFFQRTNVTKVTMAAGSTYIASDKKDDKVWEVGLFGGGIHFSDQDGWFGGAEVKRKF